MFPKQDRMCIGSEQLPLRVVFCHVRKSKFRSHIFAIVTYTGSQGKILVCQLLEFDSQTMHASSHVPIPKYIPYT